jgi:flagellar basal-body rod protein FlgC
MKMNLFTAMNISASGLSAQRVRMNVIAENLANVNTTKTPEGTPFRRKEVLFSTQSNDALMLAGYANTPGDIFTGVRVTQIIEDQSPFREVYEPGHPEANERGVVLMPNINSVIEMVNMISATRAYETNVTALTVAKQMAIRTLEIGA